MEYLVLLTVAVVAFYIGFKVSSLVSAKAFSDILQELGVSASSLKQLMEVENSSETELALKVRVEEVEGVLYAYRDDTGEFITQATSTEDITTKVAERMCPPGMTTSNIRSHVIPSTNVS
jgi:hypothetical protein